MASATARQLLIKSLTLRSDKNLSSAKHRISEALAFSRSNPNDSRSHKLSLSSSSHQNLSVGRVAVKSSAGKDGVTSADGEGVSLGTMKLPLNTDIARFETLLFQWANSLCQGAMLPLPTPLKVDKIEGGVRVGFAEIDDGKSQVSVYINCVVVPGSSESEPATFIATRNGAQKNKVPPGEPRIMKSLLAALQTSVEIARV